MSPATLSFESRDAELQAQLGGDWTLAAIAPRLGGLQAQLAAHGADRSVDWDLSGVEALDSVGAMLLWHAWGARLPEHVTLSEHQRHVFEGIAEALAHKGERPPRRTAADWLLVLGLFTLGIARHCVDFAALVGRIVLDCGHCLRHPGDLPWREFSATLYKAGARAMPVAGLVGFLIGVTLSYLSALQLKNFGADVYIVNILGLGIIRELGPVLVAVLVAGRSGSAMTAQLGVMRVTEEIDALATMGISRTLRLVLPKVAGLTVAMPLLVLWTTAVALLGGMVSAQAQLDIDYGFFIDALSRAVPVANLWIGLSKGAVFGLIVALVACHFGLRVRPNTESLSANTTRSVVTSITAVILVDAIFAVATRGVGVPV